MKQSTKVTVKSEKQRILEAMALLDPNDPSYEQLAKQLGMLNDINSKEVSLSNPIVWQTFASIGGITMVLLQERLHVITSRAFGLIKKP